MIALTTFVVPLVVGRFTCPWSFMKWRGAHQLCFFSVAIIFCLFLLVMHFLILVFIVKRFRINNGLRAAGWNAMMDIWALAGNGRQDAWARRQYCISTVWLRRDNLVYSSDTLSPVFDKGLFNWWSQWCGCEYAFQTCSCLKHGVHLMHRGR